MPVTLMIPILIAYFFVTLMIPILIAYCQGHIDSLEAGYSGIAGIEGEMLVVAKNTLCSFLKITHHPI